MTYISQQLVYFLISGTNPVNIFVKERMVKLDRKFAKLLGFAHEKLTALVSVDTLRVYITHLSVSQKENIPLFSKHMTEIISETSHSKIFALLSRMGAWSMLNFHLLHGIAEEYGDEELKAAVSHYSTDVNLFKQETTLEDFLCVWSSRSAYGSLPERQPLIAKLKVEWKDCTLATVAQEECYLANEFQLEPHIMHFSNGNPGCVVLMWLIPAAAVSLIQEAVKEKGSTLKKKILQLIVGDKTFVFKVWIHNHVFNSQVSAPAFVAYNGFSVVCIYQNKKLQSGAWEQGYIRCICAHELSIVNLAYHAGHSRSN